MNRKIIWWVLIIIWCSFIFYQSGKPAVESSKSSMYIVSCMNSILGSVIGPGNFEVTETPIRKTAHVMEYLVLGMLLFNGFIRDGQIRRTFGFSAGTGILYAITDEVHQHFVPGRAMRAFDVLIDTIGVFLGIMLVYGIYKRKNKAVS